MRPFDLRAKVIGLPRGDCPDFRLPLVHLRLCDFADEVGRATPAPGGGSIAALAGSLGAALAAMVANLTQHKTPGGPARVHLAFLAEKAEQIKDQLLRAVDDDAAAFDAYLQAWRGVGDCPNFRVSENGTVL